VTFRIAIAGKGGVGKTLIGGVLVRALADRGGPVLAVDADANANLHEVLDVAPGASVGAIREELKSLGGEVPGGMTKAQFIEYKVETALVEEDGFDLLVMGRPEGPGCYCYANNLLRDLLGRVADRYSHVVIDNEAGMEHLSRRLTGELDLLLIVSDPSLRGVATAQRLAAVPDEVETRVRAKALLVNRVPPTGLTAAVQRLIDDGALPLAGLIAEDPAVARCDQELGHYTTLFPDSGFARGVADLAAQLVGEHGTST